MERIIILLLITPFLALSFYIFQRRRYFNFSAFEIFVFFFTIYFVLVPIDHILGLHIREHQSFLSLNFDENNVEPSYRIISVLLLYLLFFISVFFGYAFFAVTKNLDPVLPKPTIPTYKILYKPSRRVLLVFNLIILFIYISIDLSIISDYFHLSSSLKQVRTQIGINENILYRSFSFISNFFVSFNTLLIIVARNKQLTKIALISIIVMALYMGDRSTIFIALFIALLVHKPKINHVRVLLITVMMAGAFIYFKPVYNYMVASFVQEDHYNFIDSIGQINPAVSRIEGLSPFEVIQTVSNSNIEYRLGETYLLTTLLTATPSIIYKSDVDTLAVEFKKTYAPESRGFFGFSPVAEAIINFGIIGLPIVGFFVGFYLFFISTMKQGFLYFINIMIIIRFFRTDFSSLVKRYFVVELSAMLVSILLLMILFICLNQFNKRTISC